MIEYEQIRTLPEDYILRKIDEFLQEDTPDGDKTTEGIYVSSRKVRAIIQAEDDLVLAGANCLKYFFYSDFVKLNYNDGDFVPNSAIIAEIETDASEILTKERTILNLMQRLSGIATFTSKYTAIANPHNVKILDTRKTTPGLRLFEKYAVTMGGGYNHRLDLSSGILIKDNHIQAAGGITNALNSIKSKHFGLPIELEVENEDQIKEAMDCGLDGFLLDNMNRERTISAVKLIRSYPNGNDIFIESSGGINLSNLPNYVDTGINAISIGALTHSVMGANIHMEFEEI